MKRAKHLLCLFMAMMIVLMAVPFSANALSGEKVLFSGTGTSKWVSWSNWTPAVNLDCYSNFDVDDLADPFAIEVAYKSNVAPILVFLSWDGGPEWTQINASYSENGVAYYKYDVMSAGYGSDFSLLNSIRMMPNEADLTVTKVTLKPDSGEKEEIVVNYKGIAGEIANNINVGWNLGNTLDSHGTWIKGGPSAFETAWGNPVTTKAMIDDVKEAGFNAVRVPITWEAQIDDNNNYKIDEAWMNRVQEVIDYVIDNNMYCLLNIHHDTGTDGWLKASTANFNKNQDKFVAIWKQICERFGDYSDLLLFEGFNEMLNESDNWGYPGKDSTTAINKYNQAFIDTVRATGGKNATRCLVVNTYAASTNSAVLDDFVVPTDTVDDSLIVQVHYYNPNAYCFDQEGNTNTQTVWTENGGKATADTTFYSLYNKFTKLSIPVIIGEIAAAAKNNESDRADYIGYIVEQANNYGIKCFWWDNGGAMNYGYTSMGIYDRYNLTWDYPEITDALTKTISPTPTIPEEPTEPTEPLAISSLKSSIPTGVVEAGTEVSWTVNVAGGTQPYTYQYEVMFNNKVVDTVAYSTNATFTQTLTDAGKHKVKITVKDADGTTVVRTSGVFTVEETVVIPPVSNTEFAMKLNSTYAYKNGTVEKTSGSNNDGQGVYYAQLRFEGSSLVLPLRYVAESAGLEVGYDSMTGLTTITDGKTTVKIIQDSSNIIVVKGGVESTVDIGTPAKPFRQVLHIPVRGVLNQFDDLTIKYDYMTGFVTVTDYDPDDAQFATLISKVQTALADL